MIKLLLISFILFIASVTLLIWDNISYQKHLKKLEKKKAKSKKPLMEFKWPDNLPRIF